MSAPRSKAAVTLLKLFERPFETMVGISLIIGSVVAAFGLAPKNPDIAFADLPTFTCVIGPMIFFLIGSHGFWLSWVGACVLVRGRASQARSFRLASDVASSLLFAAMISGVLSTLTGFLVISKHLADGKQLGVAMANSLVSLVQSALFVTIFFALRHRLRRAFANFVEPPTPLSAEAMTRSIDHLSTGAAWKAVVATQIEEFWTAQIFLGILTFGFGCLQVATMAQLDGFSAPFYGLLFWGFGCQHVWIGWRQRRPDGILLSLTNEGVSWNADAPPTCKSPTTIVVPWLAITRAEVIERPDRDDPGIGLEVNLSEVAPEPRSLMLHASKESQPIFFRKFADNVVLIYHSDWICDVRGTVEAINEIVRNLSSQVKQILSVEPSADRTRDQCITTNDESSTKSFPEGEMDNSPGLAKPTQGNANQSGNQP